jgi:hypothetical protein
MAIPNFNQINSVDLTTVNPTVIYRLGTTVAGVDKVQINSIRLVNRTTLTVFVNAWSSSGSTGTANANYLVSGFPVPPNDWRDLVDVKKIAHSVVNSSIIVQADVANVMNVILGGFELS